MTLGVLNTAINAPSLDVTFTGTQEGMTDKQLDLVESILHLLSIHKRGRPRIHLGDCIGSDDQAAGLIADGLTAGWHTIGHPAIVDDTKRVFRTYDEEREPRPPLMRNQVMVNETGQAAHGLTLATPKLIKPEVRSGTWATVRYSNKRGVPVVVVWPNGNITEDFRS